MRSEYVGRLRGSGSEAISEFLYPQNVSCRRGFGPFLFIAAERAPTLKVRQRERDSWTSSYEFLFVALLRQASNTEKRLYTISSRKIVFSEVLILDRKVDQIHIGMAFWGIEIKSGKSYTHLYSKERGRLHISQATLGWGGSTKKSVVQCNVGNKSPVLLCSLLPEKTESCPLNLEFEEAEEVTFSIVGPRSVHLTGYYLGGPIRQSVCDGSETESYGEDIGESETERSSDHSEDEYEVDFIDDGEIEVLPPSPGSCKRDKERPSNGKLTRKRLKKRVSDFDGKDGYSPQVVKGIDKTLCSEDEIDGFPISMFSKRRRILRVAESEEESDQKRAAEVNKMKADDGHDQAASTTRKSVTVKQFSNLVGEKSEPLVVENSVKQKKKKNIDSQAVGSSNGTLETSDLTTQVQNPKLSDDQNHDLNSKGASVDVIPLEAKKRKKSRSRPSRELGEQQLRVDSSGVKTTSDELVIKDITMGNPTGKIASHGDKVAILYSAMLKKNKHIFDSNIGGKPLKFRLGKGRVIKGLEVGVTGMAVGGKRRLRIPPSMGYGSEGAEEVPGNSWLEFDVELVNVQ